MPSFVLGLSSNLISLSIAIDQGFSGPNVLSVVLGGKRVSGLQGAGDQIVDQILDQEDSKVSDRGCQTVS